jgi:hypothetical protein
MDQLADGAVEVGPGAGVGKDLIGALIEDKYVC